MSSLDFIDLSNAFKYSINIRYDIGNINKLNSFIATRKNLELFRDIFSSFKKNSVTRSRILIGAYGTGKSYFSMVLASILSDKDELDKYNSLLEKINKLDPNLKANIENEIANKPPYLLILPSTNYKSFTQAMLNGLKRALDDNDIKEEVFPKTNFQAVKDKITQWENNYPETYKKFIDKLELELGDDIEKYLEKIDKYDKNSYELFVKWYEDLTSGGNFDPYVSSDLTEIYIEVNKEIRKLGYKGIFIIYDEFNKLLENNIENFDGIALQNFAEMASRSDDEEIHLLLISHKDLIQYTSDISKKQTEEWKKIEERFKIIESINHSNEIYELIGSVINKNDGWESFVVQNKNKLEDYAHITNQLNIYPSMDYEELKENIIKKCYPIHPLGVNLLPKLAQRIAQNERTLFTFLSSEDPNTLGRFIKDSHNESFPLVDLEYIYDYFESLMQQEMDYKNIHNAWADTQIALQKINEKEIYKKKILKSLAIIKAVNNYSEVSPSKDILKFALSHLINDDKFEAIFNELIKKKIIIERKSINQIDFFDGSELNVNELIENKIKQNKEKFNPNYILENYFNPAPIYPKKYNDEYKIKRYFVGQYIASDELINIDDWKTYLENYNSEGYLDGIVNYVIYEKESQKEHLKKSLKKVDDKRVIFVLPKNPLKVNNLLQRLDALLLLKKDNKLIEKDKFILKEIKAYIKEIKAKIEDKLDNGLLVSEERMIINDCKVLRIKNGLSNIASTICSEIYDKTPKINNELIVRNKITSPQKRARKKINEKLLYDGLSKRLGIDGYGPEYLIYRSFFKSETTNLIKEKNGMVKFRDDLVKNNVQGKVGTNLKIVLNKLKRDLFKTNNEVCFGDIYHELRENPYGIRLGVIPILIVIAGRLENDIDSAIIKHNGEEREITPQLFEEINRYPNRFTIKKIEWNQFIEEYIGYLENKFAKYIDQTSEINRLERVYSGINNWLINLTNYSKECEENISSESKLLRRIFLGQQKEAKTLILEILPKRLSDDFGENWNQELVNQLKLKFENLKSELNSAYINLQSDLMEIIANDIFDDVKQQNIFSSQFKNSLVSWYKSLTEQTKNNTFKRKTNAFLRLLSTLKLNDNSDKKILKDLALIITGFELEDWDDNIKKQFLNDLKKTKEEVKSFEKTNLTESSNEKRIEFYLKDVSGSEYKKTFAYQELEDFAGLLEKNVRSTFKDIGDSVSDAEKQQIAINLLKDIINNNL